LKDKVWEDGTKQFGSQIDAEKQKLENFFKDNISVDALKNKVGVSLPDDEVKKLGTEFEDKFDTVKKAIEASSLGGGLL
jgi:acyl carrier protein